MRLNFFMKNFDKWKKDQRHAQPTKVIDDLMISFLNGPLHIRRSRIRLRESLIVSVLPCQACHNFLVKKPKIFENVKSERAAANFQKSRTLRASTIISKHSQI